VAKPIGFLLLFVVAAGCGSATPTTVAPFSLPEAPSAPSEPVVTPEALFREMIATRKEILVVLGEIQDDTTYRNNIGKLDKLAVRAGELQARLKDLLVPDREMRALLEKYPEWQESWSSVNEAHYAVYQKLPAKRDELNRILQKAGIGPTGPRIRIPRTGEL
jgi:hypothetical protein